MYVQGVSTRKVAAVLEELCGTSVSSTHVSHGAARLDAELECWRSRPLGAFPYVILDARYEKVRHGGRVIDCAMPIALGIGLDGQRQILGASVALSEAEVHWRDFLQSLQKRGLCSSSAMTMPASPPPAAPSSPPSPGNAASSTSSRTPRPTSRVSSCAQKSPPTPAASSSPRTAPTPKPGSRKSSPPTPPLPQSFPPGWRKTSPKG